MYRSDRESHIFHYSEARMVTTMVNIVLRHKKGKTWTKVKLCVVYKDHKHALVPMFSKVAMVTCAASAPRPRFGEPNVRSG